jgi:GNAT superfamily N-acetyltransferase
MDAASPVYAIVAVSDSGDLVGIANYLIHESTSALAPACYLQDLFVDPAARASGLGKLLINWLVAIMGRRAGRALTGTPGKTITARAAFMTSTLRTAASYDASSKIQGTDPSATAPTGHRYSAAL